jgi:hypothetical protein
MKKVIPAGNKSGQPGQQKKKQLGGSKRRWAHLSARKQI